MMDDLGIGDEQGRRTHEDSPRTEQGQRKDPQAAQGLETMITGQGRWTELLGRVTRRQDI